MCCCGERGTGVGLPLGILIESTNSPLLFWWFVGAWDLPSVVLRPRLPPETFGSRHLSNLLLSQSAFREAPFPSFALETHTSPLLHLRAAPQFKAILAKEPLKFPFKLTYTLSIAELSHKSIFVDANMTFLAWEAFLVQ